MGVGGQDLVLLSEWSRAGWMVESPTISPQSGQLNVTEGVVCFAKQTQTPTTTYIMTADFAISFLVHGLHVMTSRVSYESFEIPSCGVM